MKDSAGSLLGLILGLLSLLAGVIWTVSSAFFYLASEPAQAVVVLGQMPAAHADSDPADPTTSAVTKLDMETEAVQAPAAELEIDTVAAVPAPAEVDPTTAALEVPAVDPKAEPKWMFEFKPSPEGAPVRGKCIQGRDRKEGDSISIRYLPAIPAWNSENEPLAILGGPIALAALGFVALLVTGGMRRSASTAEEEPALDTQIEEKLRSGNPPGAQ